MSVRRGKILEVASKAVRDFPAFDGPTRATKNESRKSRSSSASTSLDTYGGRTAAPRKRSAISEGVTPSANGSQSRTAHGGQRREARRSRSISAAASRLASHSRPPIRPAAKARSTTTAQPSCGTDRSTKRTAPRTIASEPRAPLVSRGRFSFTLDFLIFRSFQSPCYQTVCWRCGAVESRLKPRVTCSHRRITKAVLSRTS